MSKDFLKRFVPYETDYTLLDRCRFISLLFFIGISLCSLSIPFLQTYCPNSALASITNFFNATLIIAYYFLTLVTETFLYPATARKRRKGFLDNSLNSNFLERPVLDYYTNDNIPHGIYKILVNCWENCFFTYNIARKMLWGIITKNLIIITVLWVIIYHGFKDNLLAIPILQICLSAIFFTELVHHINFVIKLNILLDKAKDICRQGANSPTILGDAILLFLDYETTLAYNKAPLSNRIYRNFNDEFSRQWEEIKKRYNVAE